MSKAVRNSCATPLETTSLRTESFHSRDRRESWVSFQHHPAGIPAGASPGLPSFCQMGISCLAYFHPTARGEYKL